MCVQDGYVLKHFPRHADELRYDKSHDGQHSNATVLQETPASFSIVDRIGLRQQQAVRGELGSVMDG